MGDMLAQFATAVPGQSRTIEPAEWAAKMHELDVRRVAVIEAVVNPRTLLPAEAMTRSTVSVSDGKETTERVEEHAWTFVWDHAQQ